MLDLAMKEVRELGHDYVGTEHLLLGLLRDERGIGAQVLERQHITIDQVRAEVLRHSKVAANPRSPRATYSDEPTRIGTDGALRLFWMTLGGVILIESTLPILRVFRNSPNANQHVALLASFEVLGALLFLIPRTMRYGGWLLLAVFAIAIIVHATRGEFPAPLVVYSAGTLLVLSHRARLAN